MALFFKRKDPEQFVARDFQSEAVTAIINGASVLPAKRFTTAIYTALLDHRDVSVAELDDLANKISRLAWARGRR